MTIQGFGEKMYHEFQVTLSKINSEDFLEKALVYKFLLFEQSIIAQVRYL